MEIGKANLPLATSVPVAVYEDKTAITISHYYSMNISVFSC